jgi:hypothetical protein
LKLNGAHQLLSYTDGVNTLGGSDHTAKENTETKECLLSFGAVSFEFQFALQKFKD